MNKLTVCLTYYNNSEGLAVVLVLLQAQAVLPSEIIIIDTSDDHSGLKVAQRYAIHNCPVTVVESPKTTVYSAWNKGIKLAGQSDVLILNDDVLIPVDLISELINVRMSVDAYVYVPDTPPSTHYKNYVDADFDYYSLIKLEKSAGDGVTQVDWMPGFCFMLSSECVRDIGLFDERFKVWFGDTDYQRRVIAATQGISKNGIVKFPSSYVFHYGGGSIDYADEVTKLRIGMDRDEFNKKYGTEG